MTGSGEGEGGGGNGGGGGGGEGGGGGKGEGGGGGGVAGAKQPGEMWTGRGYQVGQWQADSLKSPVLKPESDSLLLRLKLKYDFLRANFAFNFI